MACGARPVTASTTSLKDDPMPTRWVRPTRDDLAKAALAAWSVARRRPKASLVVAAMAVFLLPLARDLFYSIPWPVRKGAGWVAFLGLLAACAWRVARVRPTDEMPAAADPSPRWHAWIFVAACAALAIPFLRHPGNLGFGDWDLFLGKHESIRRTIAEWGQFPWWDPWTRGGFPLAANPQFGVVAVATPLILAFGTSVGMRLATLVSFFLAAEGARRLARTWGIEPVSAVAAGFIYAVNGAVLVAAVAAYHVSMCYCALPWLLHHTFRLDRRPSHGAWLGFWMAFNVLNGIQYFSVYAVLITAVVWLRAARARTGAARRDLMVHTAIALGTFLALSGWRLATTGWVYHDFPRISSSGMDESPWKVLNHLLRRPSAAVLARMTAPYFWETTCYIGPVVLALALASLVRGWRWWHTLAFACGWLAVGAAQWYQPSYWLQHWPLFATMHAVTRWRFMALLGVALAAASVLSRWRLSGRPGLRRLAAALMVLIAADYLSYGYEVLPVAFSVAPAENLFPGPPTREVVQVADAMGFPAALRGYGVIHGFEPLMGYNRDAATLRLWRGHPDYVGEAWTDEGPISPRSWSPNRITFQVKPGQAVTINQNPGSWWLVNGRRPFATLRCVETMRMFTVRADERGRLELRIHPRGLEMGIGLHAAGVALMVVGWSAARALHRRDGDASSPSTRTPGGPTA
jgi:hypothetical protein